MEFYYAQLNEENICIGVSQLSGKKTENYMIELDSYDTSLLDKKYVNGVWEEVEQPEPIEVSTQLDRIEEAINKSQQDIIDEYTLSLIEEGVI